MFRFYKEFRLVKPAMFFKDSFTQVYSMRSPQEGGTGEIQGFWPHRTFKNRWNKTSLTWYFTHNWEVSGDGRSPQHDKVTLPSALEVKPSIIISHHYITSKSGNSSIQSLQFLVILEVLAKTISCPLALPKSLFIFSTLYLFYSWWSSCFGSALLYAQIVLFLWGVLTITCRNASLFLWYF